jgi:TonB family protein
MLAMLLGFVCSASADQAGLTSTGYQRLDAACLSALNGAHLIPATENGVPIEKSVDVPITWKLKPMPIAAGIPIFAGYPLLDTIRISVSITADGVVQESAVDQKPGKYHPTANCYVLVRIRQTGEIQAAQVVKSTGSARLDDACAKTLIGRRLTPARQDDAPIDTWQIIPIEWRFAADVPPTVDPARSEPIAILVPDQAVRLDTAAGGALLMTDAVCVAHVKVSAAGHTERVTLTHSTRSPTLDQACIDAIGALKFLAAQRAGVPVAGAANLWLQVGPGKQDSGPATESAANPPMSQENAKPSPQLLQALYLQGQLLGMEKAAGSAGRVSCLLGLWFTGDGVVRAVQLLQATGFPKIDQACLQAPIGQRIESSAPDRNFGGSTRMPITWLFVNPGSDAPHTRVTPDPIIPAIVSVGDLHPLPEYPSAALAQHAQGICKMHVTVTASGVVSSLELTQSTGSNDLDQACKDAIYGSAFVPATDGVQRIDGATDIAIDWRLPADSSPQNVN